MTEPSPVFEPGYTNESSSIFLEPMNDVPPSPFVENAFGFEDRYKVILSIELPPANPPPPPPELQPAPPFFSYQEEEEKERKFDI